MKSLSKLRKENKYSPETIEKLKTIFKGTKMASDYNTSNRDCLTDPDEMEYELLTLMMKTIMKTISNTIGEPVFTIYLKKAIRLEPLGLEGYIDEFNIYHSRLGISGGECYDTFWAWLNQEEKSKLFPVLKKALQNPDNLTVEEE